MIKILLSGANGKMGKVIAQIVKNKENMKIVAGFDVVTDAYDDFPIYSTPSEFEGEADAIIDFSHPSALLPLLKFAENRQIPAVIATTGLTQEQKNTLFETSKRVPVFFSANMSLGVNLLADLVKRAAKVLYENSILKSSKASQPENRCSQRNRPVYRGRNQQRPAAAVSLRI